jgi:hypothetical protein
MLRLILRLSGPAALQGGWDIGDPWMGGCHAMNFFPATLIRRQVIVAL